MSAPLAREIAAAKINLALHVRGRRADGRHDLAQVAGHRLALGDDEDGALLDLPLHLRHGRTIRAFLAHLDLSLDLDLPPREVLADGLDGVRAC